MMFDRNTPALLTRPTSDVKICRGGVTRSIVVGRHAFILPLVRLFALLYLEGSWLGIVNEAAECGWLK